MNSRTIVYSLGVIFLLSAFGASSASAQYFENARPSYLPTQSNQKDLTLSRAGAESGFDMQGPPPLRFGLALDFGAGGLRHTKLDGDFFVPNHAPEVGGVISLAWDLTAYLQVMDSFRIGANVGQLTGRQGQRDVTMLHAGLNIEGGRRFYNGVGLWAGANVGYGRGLFESAIGTGASANYYRYMGRGIGIRAFLRFEYEVAPFITLRLTPFVDTLVRTNEWYEEDVVANAPAMYVPDKTRGTFLGYGGMIGVAIHSF